MRVTLAWLRLDTRRRWRSLTVLGLLIALSAGTVLGAIAAARRGETALGRLLARTLPATATVLPNQPGFDWAKIRALPEVTALTTFAVAGYGIKGLPAAVRQRGLPARRRRGHADHRAAGDAAGRMFDPRRAGRGRGHPGVPGELRQGRG